MWHNIFGRKAGGGECFVVAFCDSRILLSSISLPINCILKAVREWCSRATTQQLLIASPASTQLANTVYTVAVSIFRSANSIFVSTEAFQSLFSFVSFQVSMMEDGGTAARIKQEIDSCCSPSPTSSNNNVSILSFGSSGQEPVSFNLIKLTIF